MKVQNLLLDLRKKGVKIVVKSENLSVQGDTSKITPEMLSELKSRKKEIIQFLNGKRLRFGELTRFEDRDFYPLSSAQKRMYIIQQMNKDSTAYNIPINAYLGTIIDKEKILNALNELIQRHDILRTSFYEENGSPVQKIHDRVEVEFRELELKEEKFEEFTRSFVKPFRLDSAPLIRAGLIHMPDESYALIIDVHHIITDGISNMILKREFGEIYGGKKLEPLKLRYVDFSLWENMPEQREKITLEEKFWIKNFKSKQKVLNLPTDYERGDAENRTAKNLGFSLPAEKFLLVKRFAEEHGLTMHMSVFSLFVIVLSKLSGQNEITIGNVVAGRNHEGLESVIGIFINMLPIRVLFNPNESLSNYAAEIKKTITEVFENQNYPFEKLVEKVSKSREVGRQPLFDVVMNFMSMDGASTRTKDSGLYTYNSLIKSKGYDMVMNVHNYADSLDFSIQFNGNLFKIESIERMVNYFLALISDQNLNGDIKVAEIDLFGEADKQELMNCLKGAEHKLPEEKAFHEVFENQVKKNPNSVAIKFENIEITYAQLNGRANHIAQLLIEKKQSENATIGLLIDKSIEMIVAILAVLKSGCAYLPIDPSYPEKRKEFMLTDSKVDLIIAQERYLKSIEEYKVQHIAIDSKENVASQVKDNLDIVVSDDDMAYVIYTSGTTGEPKGVPIRHKNLMNLYVNNCVNFDFSSSDVWPFYHSYCFDYSVWEMFGALLFGGKLLIISEEQVKDMELFYRYIVKQGVTVLNATPSEFQYLSRIDKKHTDSSLGPKYLFLGGEKLDVKNVWNWNRKYNKCKIFNLYGLTETTVLATFKEVTFNDISSGKCNIGRPIVNSTIYLLNESENLVVKGAVGEICIASNSLTDGYFNRDVLTKERFIESPYFAEEVLYKTGDLGRLLANDEIEYLGRKDNQVQIRGNRVELEEIESILRQQDNIDELKLIVHEKNNETVLGAYYVSKVDIDKSELRDYLQMNLPKYMLPNFYEQLDKMPLASTGKLDLNGFQIPNEISTENHTQPQNEIEEKLLEIWATILELDKKTISTTDNFFEIGGHSLIILSMVAEIKEQFDVLCPIMRIYEEPSIRAIARMIELDDMVTKELHFFNSKDLPKVFCIPPRMSVGVVYMDLARAMSDYCICALNVIDVENPIADIVDKIINIQEEGPYVILGYSGGGTLLYPITVELEKRGKEISKLISIDGYWEKREGSTAEEDDARVEAAEVFKNLNIEYLQEELKARMKSYAASVRNIEFSEKVNAQVHFLLSEGHGKVEDETHMETEEKRVSRIMDKFSVKETIIYRATGFHNHLLDKKETEANSKIIESILKS